VERGPGATPQFPRMGARFCGNVQPLADYSPPGLGRGNKTLRGGITGLGIVAIDTASFRRKQKRSELGWHSDVLVARNASAPL
jgi:hypothetical protein